MSRENHQKTLKSSDEFANSFDPVAEQILEQMAFSDDFHLYLVAARERDRFDFGF